MLESLQVKSPTISDYKNLSSYSFENHYAISSLEFATAKYTKIEKNMRQSLLEYVKNEKDKFRSYNNTWTVQIKN